MDGDNDGGVGVVVCVAECFDGGVESAGRLAIERGREHGSVSPSIASIGGTPYVAWSESNGAADQVRVAQFTGDGWTAVGGALNVAPAMNAEGPSIASIGGTPYVAWQEFNGSAFQVRVAQFTGGAWTAVVGSLNVDPTKDANSPTPSGSAAPAHP